MVMEMEPKERLVRGTGNERITITAIDQQSYGLTEKQGDPYLGTGSSGTPCHGFLPGGGGCGADG